ncbi:hypothetical protein FA13DRAFT_1738221 [Coprinellus micaceus]|uniref:Protein kinase domain-containing protein n=1 Tax=Coprinellus micaceus TaxID=71717 RepID=A0A4Y7SUE6_COPMI|nr:hypothetical protein FA13DRAFT_1738221 [Coprinellus micaceus]
MGSLISSPRPAVHVHEVNPLSAGVAVTYAGVCIVADSIRCPDPLTNVYEGHYRGQSARFKEYRRLDYHAREGIDVCAMLMNEARLRRRHQTANHVPVSGVYQATLAHGSSSFLIEAPYHYVPLKEYLSANPDADRKPLLKEALHIIGDLHCKGLVLGVIRLKSFVVDPSGKLFLSGFETMRAENPSSPFRAVLNPSFDSMACMAPELLQSMGTDGLASLTRATDTYAVGCFAYELFIGDPPFLAKYRGYPTHMAQFQLIRDVVGGAELPERPAMEACARSGLTDEIWGLLTECWSTEPSLRPSVYDVLARVTLT